MYRLPDLPFGNADAKVLTNSKVAAEAMVEMLPSASLLPKDRQSGFAAKSAARSVGDLGLLASAITPSKLRVGDSPGWLLIVPFFGLATMAIERTSIVLEGGLSGAFVPNMQRETENTSRMAVMANLDIGRLRGTADAIAGGNPVERRIEEQPHAIDMRRQRETFPAFQQLCSLIDLTSDNPNFANVLGLEDAVYRWTIHSMGLLPQETVRLPSEAREHHKIDVICDLVRPAHERALTLTEMERHSGLSARALQYAFKARFGCSPMEWQRRERMQLARSRILFGATGETITEIAYSMGFSSPAAFTALYRRQFGETPSQSQRPDGLILRRNDEGIAQF